MKIKIIKAVDKAAAKAAEVAKEEAKATDTQVKTSMFDQKQNLVKQVADRKQQERNDALNFWRSLG